ncbi:hypothetical protein [Streptomyces collinus]|uniref:Secreted protein n=1 Tax=Streptomyces collinus (strain DSM 40733 / Tue 365) TaxID=1214242 RepID=S5VMP8_STRC3|nr:hypothetical protein [Streptomyces collinus]AGS69650.1 hypothetical protein B446_14160 [Streptomyces collinus Tu 365]UJA08291.1 hypothetical protein HGI10_22010 [Streptomyces collinus]UJA16844.1 hypothetical protein HGI09_42100 [Streptomyces collinus]
MTHPPKSSAAPPQAGPALPAVPPQPGPPAPASPPPAPTGRRTAFAEGAERLRAAATTEPGRLRIIGAVLALLVVAFGAVTAWQTSERAAAADDVLHRSQPLSSGAAGIYRSLADANTAASSGFLAGGQESAASRDRYEKDIRAAAGGLVTAAANAEPGSSSEATIARLNRLLPEYKGLIERARTYNRQGYPVGGAYLRYANEKMQQEMLPAAEDLYTKENQRLDADYADATPYPWAAIALGVLALAALGWAQHRTYQRTNRVLNHGLVAGTAATTVVLLWLVVGHAVARTELNGSYDHGIRSLKVLHDARIASLKARGNENLSLVARGAETVTVGGQTYDAYYYDFDKDMNVLGRGLTEAAGLADDQAGTKPVTAARGNMAVWKKRHATARGEDENGNYQQALDLVIGGKGATGACFDSVDSNLARAIDHEQTEFRQAAGSGLDAMTGLTLGAAVLAVLGAAGAVAGIGRRLSEYR